MGTLKKCDALRDLVPFAQFKKHEKTPLRSVTCKLIKGKWLKYKRYEMEQITRYTYKIAVNQFRIIKRKPFPPQALFQALLILN